MILFRQSLMKIKNICKCHSVDPIFFNVSFLLLFLLRSALEKDLFIQQKKHFGGAFVNITHSTVHVPTIIYSLGIKKKENLFFPFPTLVRVCFLRERNSSYC